MTNSNKPGKDKKPHHENPLPGEINSKQKEKNAAALRQADKDISNDAELSAHNKNDDLDEGESARLGEDKNDLV
jgi:hypothetical protein